MSHICLLVLLPNSDTTADHILVGKKSYGLTHKALVRTVSSAELWSDFFFFF